MGFENISDTDVRPARGTKGLRSDALELFKAGRSNQEVNFILTIKYAHTLRYKYKKLGLL